MSRDGIGRLLILLHDADRLVVSFAGEFRNWWRPSPSTSLVVTKDDAHEGRLRLGGPGPFPRASEIIQRIWFEQPDRMRVEIVSGGRVVRLGVRDESNWWRWDSARGTDGGTIDGGTSGRGQRVPRIPPLLDPPMLSPARMLHSLRWEPAGASERLGRSILLAHAEPRRPVSGRSRVSVELEVDAQYGTVLRRAVFQNGTCTHLIEALEANFDQAIEPDLFVFAPL